MIYVSPDVDDGAAGVTVIALDPATVAAANAGVATPRALPAAFRQVAGSGEGTRAIPAGPAGVMGAQVPPGAMRAVLPPEEPARPYRIGIGDVVVLATRASGTTVEELTGLLAAQNRRQGYTVQDDGAISVPDVGRVAIAGMTIEEAEAAVFGALVGQQIDPTFSLEIAEFKSQVVLVGGAVPTPAAVPVTLTGLTLGRAIVAAGGFDISDEDGAVIRLYRGGTLYQVPVRDYLRGGAVQALPLHDGDAVFVDATYDLDRAASWFAEQITLAQNRRAERSQALAELEGAVALRRAALAEARSGFDQRLELGAEARDHVYLAGEVASPGRFPLPFERHATLADALFGQDGLAAETGNPAQIYVLRGADAAGTRIDALHLDARDVTQLVLATRLRLQANDVVFVAEQPVTRWNRVMKQIIPSILTSTANALQ